MATDPPKTIPIRPIKGRGASTNEGSRFDAWRREADPEAGTDPDIDEERRPATTVTEERARSIISRNDSPDIPFEHSINPYRGCEHGCVYCYARPTHAYLGLSPGLDFETRLYAKPNAAAVLEDELRRPGYVPKWIALGANTDPYQPIERRLQITRAVLRVLSEFNHPVGITTKSALCERDIDILAPMAAKGLARVLVSVGTLDAEIARRMEPRASSPTRRIEAIGRLAAAGIPAGVIVAPIIPALTDPDLERVLEAARGAGAATASYTVLRLPLEVRDLFVQWLEQRFPLRARHVMSLVQQMRDGRDNDPAFGRRMRGTGIFAELVRRRFEVARGRLGFDRAGPRLDSSQFRIPGPGDAQLSLF
ncbi:MAG TPA: PA0069 family radical SAM protein [Burkholderiaceae bacterium]|nr:PA0069 family radical SAM protein [Burkholderiaceae bacterium]